MEEWREDEGWGNKELERVYMSECEGGREGKKERNKEKVE